MSDLDDLALLAAPTWRSRAYVQGMIATGMTPSRIFLLPGKQPGASGLRRSYRVEEEHGLPGWEFRPGLSLTESLCDGSIPTQTLTEPDINHPENIAALKDDSASVVVYSGAAGVLLRAPLLACGKRFLHVHGGYAPAYRGSTAFYYSLLRDGTLGATALWLEEAIDEGPILRRDTYSPQKTVEIDRVLDPIVRTRTLLQVLRERVATGVWSQGIRPDAGEAAFTYYVIHPLLKHLVLKQQDLCS